MTAFRRLKPCVSRPDKLWLGAGAFGAFGRGETLKRGSFLLRQRSIAASHICLFGYRSALPFIFFCHTVCLG